MDRIYSIQELTSIILKKEEAKRCYKFSIERERKWKIKRIKQEYERTHQEELYIPLKK